MKKRFSACAETIILDRLPERQRKKSIPAICYEKKCGVLCAGCCEIS